MNPIPPACEGRSSVSCFEKVKNYLHPRGKTRFAKPRQMGGMVNVPQI